MPNITNKDVFDKADEYYHIHVDQICKTVNIESIHKNHQLLKSKFNHYQNQHWKFNTFHWANDVLHLADQLIFGYTKLKSHYLAYKEFTTDGESPSNTYGPVSFYSDSCILNLYSMRDKISLLVWSYFHPFNPKVKNEVLTYLDIVKRLKAPRNFGFNFNGQNEYVTALNEMSKGNNQFLLLEKYRHYKTHRWEPRIEIYGVKNHHGFPYSIVEYENDDVSPSIEYKKIDEVIWSYSKVDKLILDCMVNSFRSASLCFDLLSNRTCGRILTKSYGLPVKLLYKPKLLETTSF